jgi:uncharacterized membrane protein (UPF0127 family)
MLGQSQSGLAIRNERNQRHLANHLIAAFDSETRRTGLLKHESLPDGTAMVIAPTSAIHTFFMRFAIDVAFVTREGRIVKVCHGLPPWRIAIAPGAFAVIELPSGTLAGSGTIWGDTLAVVPAEQV